MVVGAALCAFSACDSPPPAAPAPQACRITPPRGPFEAPLADAPRAPTADQLPSNENASAVLLTPAPRHRWSSKVGLVESQDGSLLLHGVAASPVDGPARLTITVLVGYQAVDARLRVWTADRRSQVADASGTHLDTPLAAPVAAFDIELPRGTVPVGRWQEVQTIVTLDGARPDVRRWTLYGGPKGPPVEVCVRGLEGVDVQGGRSSLAADGGFKIRAPEAATLAVVALDRASGPTGSRHLLQLGAGTGWEGRMNPAADVVASFDGAYAGPGRDWISNFWSATRSKAVPAPKVR